MHFFVECTDPPDIRNTTVHVTDNSSVVYYECDTGFHLLGDNVLTCINGSWSSPSLICNGEYMTAYNIINYNFELKFKLRLSSISSISTKRTITSYLQLLNTKKTYDDEKNMVKVNLLLGSLLSPF